VDDDRLARFLGEPRLGLEEIELAIMWRVVAEVVEPRFPDGHRFGVVEQRCELLDVCARRPPRLMRVEAERDEDAVFAVGELERFATRGERRSDRDHPCHAGRPRSLECMRRVLDRVQVRVRVDHA
jgi:hypothetical protein